MKRRWRSALGTPVALIIAVIVTYALTTLTRSSAETASHPATAPFPSLQLPAASTRPLQGPYTINASLVPLALLGFPSIGTSAPDSSLRAATTSTATLPGDVTKLDDLAVVFLTHSDLATGLANLGRAERVLDRALTLQPADYRATVYLSWVRLAQHRYAEAALLASQAIHAQPNVQENYGTLGSAQLGLGHETQAAAAFQRLTDLQPDLVAYSDDAAVRWAEGDTQGAFQFLRMALNAGDARPSLLAWSTAQLGARYLANGDLLAAEEQYNAALQLDARSPVALAGLAQVRVAQSRIPEAIALYRQAIDRAPLPAFATALADLYRARGRASLARAALDRARILYTRQAAQGVDVSLNLALLAIDQGKPASGAAQIARAALIARQDAPTQDAAAEILYAAGHYREALSAEDRALAHGEKSALYNLHEGMILDRLGRPADALAYVQEAVMHGAAFGPHEAGIAYAALHSLAQHQVGS